MRFVIEYACAGMATRDCHWPVGLVVQDDIGVYARPLFEDPALLAAKCDLPIAAFLQWEEDTQSRLRDPVFGRDGRPLDASDPRWLYRFARASMEAKFFWGPVCEIEGQGEAALQRAMAAIREENRRSTS